DGEVGAVDGGWKAELGRTLTEQHRRVRALSRRVSEASGQDRAGAFLDLRRFLAAHEAAEASTMHACFHAVDREDVVVGERLEEEDDAAQAIAELESMEIAGADFGERFSELTDAVLTHAESEEHQELPAFLHR